MLKRLRIIFSYIMIVALVVAMVPQLNSYAQEATEPPSCDEDFYASNDILYYNPCANFCTATPGASTGAVSSLTGANNGEKIYNFWIAAGMTPQQAAGITGSMKHEGGFSPFRQEMSQAWPNGGWGIAQFTFDPGQRGSATAYVRNAIGEGLFNQYYQNQYGGAVLESNGFIPQGVPVDVNDKFLLAELNYLLEHIQGLNPNNIRRDYYQRDFAKTIPADQSLYEYLKTLQTPGEGAVAWTYLYEFPADIKNTSLERAESADQLAALFSGGSQSSTGGSCGGLVTGGMNLDQAKAFMETYDQINDGDPNGDKKYLGIGCNSLTDNCVAFSSYFVKKYTTLQFGSAPGAKVVNATLAVNPQLESGTEPRPYALFSTEKTPSVTRCDFDDDGDLDGRCGHTGIILGVDTARGVVITGEASWCDDSWTGAYEYPIDEWSDGTYIYAYLDPYLQSDKGLTQ